MKTVDPPSPLKGLLMERDMTFFYNYSFGQYKTSLINGSLISLLVYYFYILNRVAMW